MLPARTLHETFDRIVCINLGRRPERWERFRSAIARIGTPPERVIRFAAIDGSRLRPPPWWRAGRGAWGCHQSHVRILEDAMQDRIGSLLILEDDVVFDEPFAARFAALWDELPPDWDALLLGGRHVVAPMPLSASVVRVRGARRTHAHALRGRYVADAYHHLCDYPDHALHPSHHVDHRFCRMHRSGAYNVYGPATWLAGQDAGFSDIVHSPVPRRFWHGPNEGRHGIRPSHRPAAVDRRHAQRRRITVAVLGPYRSGSSCVAGVLHHLGLYLGPPFCRTDRHNETGYFEPRDLRLRLRRAWDEPSLTNVLPRDDRVRLLRGWMRRQARAAAPGQSVAVKHPLLCLMGEEMLEAWGAGTRFIAVHRPLEESCRSLDRTDWWEPAWRRPLIERLWTAQREFLAGREHLAVDFGRLRLDPASEVRRVVDFLGIPVADHQFDQAVRFVRTGDERPSQ